MNKCCICSDYYYFNGLYTICKAIHVEDEQILASLRTHHFAIHVSDNQTTYGLIFQPVTDNAHKIY